VRTFAENPSFYTLYNRQGLCGNMTLVFANEPQSTNEM